MEMEQINTSWRTNHHDKMIMIIHTSNRNMLTLSFMNLIFITAFKNVIISFFLHLCSGSFYGCVFCVLSSFVKYLLLIYSLSFVVNSSDTRFSPFQIILPFYLNFWYNNSYWKLHFYIQYYVISKNGKNKSTD